MRILLLSQFYPPIIGGEERHVRNLANALVQRGHAVDVATQWVPGERPFELDSGIGIHRIRGTLQRLSGLFVENERRHAPPFPDPELVSALRQIVLKLKPDIVHAHNWLVTSFLPVKAWFDLPLVVTLHDYSLVCAKKNFVYDDELCKGPKLSRCLPCAKAHYHGTAKATVTTMANFVAAGFARRVVDRYIAVSRAVARHNGLVERFEIIPNFVPDNVSELSADLDPCLEQLPKEPFILFVGDVMHLKGADVLLNAYARHKNMPPLVLIGRRTPDTPAVLPPNVYLFSTWPHTAIMHAWHRCLFGVLPSVGPEACATVIMEAMASGKPMIATDIGGMPDLVDHGETGLLVPPNDAVALGDALEWLVTKPETIARMGETSRVQVERLKASAVVARIEQVYQTVLSERVVHV